MKLPFVVTIVAVLLLAGVCLVGFTWPKCFSQLLPQGVLCWMKVCEEEIDGVAAGERSQDEYDEGVEGDIGEALYEQDEEKVDLGIFEKKWTGSRVLSAKDGFKIHWRVEHGFLLKPSELILKMEMNNVLLSGGHSGWMGFGFAEFSSGSMLGADVVTVRRVPDSKKPVVEDRYVPFSAFPISPFPEMDDCQDWELVSFSSNPLKWSVVVKRALKTSDSVQDREIPAKGLTRIIWAWNTHDSEIQYHDGNRHAGTINLAVDEIPVAEIPKDAKVQIPVVLGNYVIPVDSVSHYVCQGYDLGLEEKHVVMIEPHIQDGHEHLVHHFLLHACDDSYPYIIHPASRPPNVCLDTEHGLSPLGFQGCKTLVFAWALGGSSLVLPPKTGFRIGGNNDGYRYLILEIHYNNPDLVPNIADSSGVILHATKDASSREIDATVLIVGDSQVSLPGLEPGVINHREVTCLSACTEQFTNKINVFASFLHMHNYGRQAWTMRYLKKAGEDEPAKEGVLGNHISFWSFDFQQITEMKYTITPGDQLSVHGVYDLTKAEEPVAFGQLSSEEMLFDFLFVYPKSGLNNIFLCGRQYPGMSQCGRLDNNETSIPNPVPDGMTELPEKFGKERTDSESVRCNHASQSTKAALRKN